MLDSITNKQNRFLLVYGSATGQAQAIAEEIAEKAPSFGLTAELYSLEDTGKKFNIEKEKCVVIITSTTGDGDPPANAEKFMRRIKKRTLANDYLAHLHYSMLGLGDSNYSNFCRCARDMDSRLEDLGAKRFYATGFADDGVGLEIVADPWLEGLYPALQKFLGVTGATDVTLTETVQSLSLSESDNCENLKNQEQEKNSGKTLENSLVNSSTVSNRTLENKESSVTTEPTNENCVESSHIKLTSDSGFKDGAKIVYPDDSDVRDLTYSGDTGIESSFNTMVSPEPNAALQEDTHIGRLSSLTLNGSAEETATNFTDLQAKVITTSGEATTKCLDSADKQKWPETQCVPLSLSDSPSLTLPLTCSTSPLSEQTLTIPVLPPPYLSATFGGDTVQVSSLAYQNGCKLPCAASDVFKVQVLSANVLTASDAVKKTLLLKLDLEGLDVTYSPGDSVSIICPNNSSEVDLLLVRLGQLQRADETLTLSVIPDTKKRRAAIPSHIHPVSTLRHIFTTCVNIREPPNKAFIRALIEHTSDKHEVRRMQELCSKEGANEYTHVIRESNVSLLDFLYAFPSCYPAVETILAFGSADRIVWRSLFQTSTPHGRRGTTNCQDTSPTSFDIVFNVVEIPAGKSQGHLYQRRGVCTGWLDDITSCLQSGKKEDIVKVPIFLRTNQHFRPPDDLSKPLIMIGPGTGVAPFIGFLQQRAFRKRLLEDDQAYGVTWLFYGCRNKDKDYLFREELHQFEADGTLTNLSVAFSRDQLVEDTDTTSHTPRYVQDLLRLMAQDVVSLLVESEALVYVCGDAKNMAKDVSNAFEDILQKLKGLSPDEAHMFMMKKRIHKTYFEDVWV